MKFFALVLLLPALFCGCESTMYEYHNADGGIYCQLPVKIDSSTVCEVTVVTDYGYPQIIASFGCSPWVVNNLKDINVDIIAGDTIVPADEEVVYADYMSQNVTFKSGECCDSLGKRLGVDTSQITESFNCGFQLTKEYKSIGQLPRQLTIHLSSKAAGGDTDTTIVFTLVELKDTRAVRFH